MELVEITRNVYACLQEDRGLEVLHPVVVATSKKAATLEAAPGALEEGNASPIEVPRVDCNSLRLHDPPQVVINTAQKQAALVEVHRSLGKTGKFSVGELRRHIDLGGKAV